MYNNIRTYNSIYFIPKCTILLYPLRNYFESSETVVNFHLTETAIFIVDLVHHTHISRERPDFVQRHRSGHRRPTTSLYTCYKYCV